MEGGGDEGDTDAADVSSSIFGVLDGIHTGVVVGGSDAGGAAASGDTSRVPASTSDCTSDTITSGGAADPRSSSRASDGTLTSVL